MLNEMLKSRNLPPFKSREEMLDIIQREEFGYLPEAPKKLTWQTTDIDTNCFCAGKATLQKVELTSEVGEKEFTFPVYVTIPKGKEKLPFFICVNFRDSVPDKYIPTEELVDNGFAVLSFCYEDVTRDNDDFTDGLAGILYPDGKREKNSAGKIAMWAWAVHRVMDFAESIDRLDKNLATVCGHSRLGKTALFAAATDERFKFVHSNNSGCGGAAIARGNTGEQIKDICNSFYYWFCENYKKYIDNEKNMPFDQHYLTASVAPRYVYVSSAEEDKWADPVSEMLNCVTVSEVYEKCGKKGFICDDKLPQAGDIYHEGTVGYHIREGKHYFSREDWQKLIMFINKHKDE